jgi:hypothetical protein
MATAKLRRGGAWVDADLTGQVRIDGAWVDFGAGGGPTVDESFTFAAPTLPDIDESQRVNLGTLFAVTATGEWRGVEVFTSSVALADVWGLAFNGDTATELERKQVISPGVGQLVTILFDDPPTVVAGVNYLATYSAIRYAATEGANMTWPYTTAHMYTASSLGSRFDAGPVGTVPTQVSGAGYHVSPIVRFAA